MIHSKEKQEDINHRTNLLSVAKTAMEMYEKTGNEEFLEYAKNFKKEADRLQTIIYGDYTQRNKKRREIDTLLGI